MGNKARRKKEKFMCKQVFYLDPDCRPEPNTDKPYCCRCQKVIKDVNKAIKATWVDADYWKVREDKDGELLIGMDCAKSIGMR